MRIRILGVDHTDATTQSYGLRQKNQICSVERKESMRKRTIDIFNGRGLENRKTTFKLTKDCEGKYRIKRGRDTLLIYQEEDKAREGFNTLRESRSEE